MSDYFKAELLPARMNEKIDLPFGEHREIGEHLTGDFEFLAHLNTISSFFDVFDALTTLRSTLSC